MKDEMETIAVELFSLLDNIDTLDEICKDDDAMFRAIARREAQKRMFYANCDGHKVTFKTGIRGIDEPAADCDYQPTLVYTCVGEDGHLIILGRVDGNDGR